MNFNSFAYLLCDYKFHKYVAFIGIQLISQYLFINTLIRQLKQHRIARTETRERTPSRYNARFLLLFTEGCNFTLHISLVALHLYVCVYDETPK